MLLAASKDQEVTFRMEARCRETEKPGPRSLTTESCHSAWTPLADCFYPTEKLPLCLNHSLAFLLHADTRIPKRCILPLIFS